MRLRYRRRRDRLVAALAARAPRRAGLRHRRRAARGGRTPARVAAAGRGHRPRARARPGPRRPARLRRPRRTPRPPSSSATAPRRSTRSPGRWTCCARSWRSPPADVPSPDLAPTQHPPWTDFCVPRHGFIGRSGANTPDLTLCEIWGRRAKPDDLPARRRFRPVTAVYREAPLRQTRRRLCQPALGGLGGEPDPSAPPLCTAIAPRRRGRVLTPDRTPPDAREGRHGEPWRPSRASAGLPERQIRPSARDRVALLDRARRPRRRCGRGRTR